MNTSVGTQDGAGSALGASRGSEFSPCGPGCPPDWCSPWLSLHFGHARLAWGDILGNRKVVFVGGWCNTSVSRRVWDGVLPRV